MDNIRIIQEGRAYLDGGLTIEEAARKFKISKRTLQLHIKKLEGIDKELYMEIRKKQELSISFGRQKGGELGKRKPNYTKQEAEKVANIIIKGHLTYEEASSLLDIPSSTIYEMTHSKFVDPEIKDKLYKIADANNKGTITDFQEGIKRR